MAVFALGGMTDATAQNIESLLTAPSFVIGAVVLPLILTVLLLPALWRDLRWRRRVLAALSGCGALAVLTFIAVTHGSGSLTLIWGLVFFGTPWWVTLSLLALQLLRWREGGPRRGGQSSGTDA